MSLGIIIVIVLFTLGVLYSLIFLYNKTMSIEIRDIEVYDEVYVEPTERVSQEVYLYQYMGINNYDELEVYPSIRKAELSTGINRKRISLSAKNNINLRHQDYKIVFSFTKK